jgi:prolyl-tRNA editing enzyme YbaK/EbsC (Cys-tRNA(Pro) deacylase)
MVGMQCGKLTFLPISANLELVASPVQVRVRQGALQEGVYVAAIDADLADTATFCEAYDIPLDAGANCIIVKAKRAGSMWYAACIIRGNDKIDVNGKLRSELDARRISFAPRETALELTGMEYGGITPIGLPDGLPILVDTKVLTQEYVIVGSGLRSSKILIATQTLTSLPHATVTDIAQ